ncbi:GNAT family protein [Chitinimonas naiadis]
MHIRPYHPDEAPALWRIFHSSIHRLAHRHYSPEQLAAWAPDEFNEATWTRRMAGIQPFVVEDAGQLLGYSDLQADGYIDHFFVAGEAGGKGVATLLMQHIHQLAAARSLSELYADVSLAAEGFFLRQGFQVVQRQMPVARGVTLANARMRKHLPPCDQP